MQNIPMTFPISIFNDQEEKISDTLTKKRLGIFYKGRNRNGGYITEEFAEKLISTLPYAPVKGIYDEDEQDFTDHGTRRDLGRIYGVVPQEMNFAWEKHLDPDGKEREYACTDVLLYTALYKEANEIEGKGQSMELYPPSIKGQWTEIDGYQTYKYTDASFLGLQVLGDKAIPCFQGSAFYSLQNQQMYELLINLFEKVEQISIGGKKLMENQVSFALSDNQKQNKIAQALNKDTYRYYVLDTYDDHAIVFDYETEKYLRVNYTKAEDDTVTVSEEMVEVFAIFVTKEESDALNEYRKRRDCSFTSIVTDFESLNNQISDLKTEIDNKNNEISTLNTDKEALNTTNENLSNQVTEYTTKLQEAQDQNSNFVNQINELSTKVAELTEYKSNIELNEKQALITKYSAKISKEVLDTYTARLNEFTVNNLEKELAFELVKANDSIFTAVTETKRVPSENTMTDLEMLLSKYKKD